MIRLLIVDDEPLVRRGIKSLVNFDKLNIKEVEEAVNGEEALEIFKVFKPHLILADINMPKMDGLTFAKHVKAIDENVKIALVTGYDYFDYALQALKLGVDDYILKPISKKDIEEVLIKLIQKMEEDALSLEVQKTVQERLDVSIDDDYYDIESILDREKYHADFSLKKLSDELGYNSSYLSGVFKKQYGMTFQDYLIHTRIEQAKLLLLSTELKNYEVAEKIGFTDVNYFGSRFKKLVGMSPKQYKVQVKHKHE
ncbi:MAG: response regulator [Clostridiales bacterium]|nr:response regulator [Clostridiales bacterium]